MPDLPTLTVTQTQSDRMLAAYGTVANYKTWLAKAIKDYVAAAELQAFQEQHAAAYDALIAEIKSALP